MSVDAFGLADFEVPRVFPAISALLPGSGRSVILESANPGMEWSAVSAIRRSPSHLIPLSARRTEPG